MYAAFAPMRYQCCLLPGRDPTLSWRQVDHFTCHLSFVICHLLLVTCHLQRQCRLSTFFFGGGGIAENLRCLLLIFTNFRSQLCAVCLQRGRQGVPFFNKKSSEVQDPQKHNSNFPPQGNISPGTKLEEGKGNAASGDDSSLLRAMMM